MNHNVARRSVLVLALALPCLLLGACKEKHEPLKPTVQQSVAGPVLRAA